jgi:putative hemolysin
MVAEINSPMPDTEPSLVDLRELGSSPWQKSLLGFARRVAEPVLRFGALNRSYRSLRGRPVDSKLSFFDHGLNVLGARYRVEPEDLERIPKEGPVFLLANHPFGGVDGLILGSLLDRVRPDGKLMANYLLGRIDNMGGRCFYVDPFGGPEAKQANFQGMKESLRWLREGHAMGTFPSGTVSFLKWGSRRVTDPPWAENLAPLILKTKAVVVPVYFDGRNSDLFQLAGLIHPRLRTLMLPREMLRDKQADIKVRIGNPISAKRLEHFGSPREIMDFLRLRTYILKSREIAEKTIFTRGLRRSHSGKPIVDAQPVEKLAAEIADLGPEETLAEHEPFVVYAAKASRIPHVLLEIGRLREITFRAVGEGTGEATDLDKYDSDYHHLFIWNKEEKEIVGAYRLGLTGEILPKHGKKGLYTNTLFRFKSDVIRSISPAVELGRSFVVEKYQRKPVSLGLLWKGIGQFIVRRPEYCTLFGPVSISNEYRSLSKNLMVAYLKEHNQDPVLASMVKARNPARSRFFGSLDKGSFKRSVRDIEDVSALISEIEREARGVPVLLRQYLKLNATFLSFNVDPAFNDSLDGLMLVDLRRTAAKTLDRYMGPEGASAFRRYHAKRAHKGAESVQYGSDSAATSPRSQE